ncbi:MAG: YdcF family protein [Thermodesulfobacteriota bacterium]
MPLKRRLIILISTFLLGVGLLFWGWTRLGGWLARPDALSHSEVIVCLNGQERVKKAAQLYKEGWAPRIILTVAGDKKALTDLGVDESRVLLVPGPKTTFQEALMVSPVLQRMGVRSALIVSDPFHLRRVRWTFQKVLGKRNLKMVFVASDFPWPRTAWWKDRQAKYYTYSEWSKLIWYRISYGLLNRSEDPQWAMVLKQRYQKWLWERLR